MSSSRTLLRYMETTAARSHLCQLTVARSQSSWGSPPAERRNRRYTSGAPQVAASRRAIVHGKNVAFHVNDLKKPLQNFTTTILDQQQQQQLRLRNSTVIKPPREYESDLVVVLDMDECLIHSQFLQGPGAKYAHQVRRANGTAMGETAVDTFNIELPDGELVKVHERPYLHEFLRQVSSKYETHIFTAAMEVYAKPVLKKLDPHGDIFTACWYRESCQLDSSVGAYVKNLGFCWDDEQLKRTVLVDNNPLSFLANPENGILVSSFYNDHKDTTLPAVMDLLHELDHEEDVRVVLDARFRLRQALDELSTGRPFAARGQQIDQQQAKAVPQHQEQLIAVAAS